MMITAATAAAGHCHFHSRTTSSCTRCGTRKKIALVVVLGFLMLVAAAIFSSLQLKKQATWNKTTGTIISREHCGSGMYKAVIQFNIGADVNKTHQFKPNSCSQPGPTVGKEVPVLYNPSNPEDATEASYMGTWLVPTVLGGMGVVIFSMTLCCASGGGRSSMHDRHDYDEEEGHKDHCGGDGGNDYCGGDGENDGGAGRGGGGGDCGGE